MWPAFVGDQLTPLMLPWWPFVSSTTGVLGYRISRISADAESMWKVARRFELVRQNCRRSRGHVPGFITAPLLLIGVALEGASYRIVECSSDLFACLWDSTYAACNEIPPYLKSNNRTDPSAPTLANMSAEVCMNATSYTSLSCAISWVFAWFVSTFHTVHVVSMLAVTISDGSVSFQSKDVRGAQKSLCFICSGNILD